MTRDYESRRLVIPTRSRSATQSESIMISDDDSDVGLDDDSRRSEFKASSRPSHGYESRSLTRTELPAAGDPAQTVGSDDSELPPAHSTAGLPSSEAAARGGQRRRSRRLSKSAGPPSLDSEPGDTQWHTGKPPPRRY